ncbi:MAG: tRNA (N6-isopentenyl adenosine(37)-C2)-methylthiotransferase MiaB [Gemmatimonadetes bacterium]|nr:tRNA (N6-isopentenyl adenosine(37)-C2)-methylthiotransferase MiaB [Gemmatimonadota bacterium]MXX72291.1 tRNA (N6-isopentenyl adenosine(37)-C2)-methylthiotransferase MiaB [Gemmatimonadota bacterium]MYC93041.1 tRNA (N6-isopentenyl adenosine(37)-C2)-methylthiotransferase MiaB [Gemmatimonadota bacterium]MYG34631.1 tRNA (N6-isopentenyl adenosine(37)-C2)-methylthiotransferase MiaB [Gemmatimonadota bacterium]MYJ17584.1 tRNA (N6-isopentenyl adenosine(37)-C2)-methylthiotransferase MiaB [Gemmatimonado
MKTRAYVETYGCQMNISDGELMEGVLEDQGYEIVTAPEAADVVLVNTCAIREHAETRVLGRVGQLNALKRERPDMILGVTGCMAQRMGDDLLAKAPYVDLVMGPDGYRGLGSALAEIRGRGTGAPGAGAGSRRRLSVLDLSLDENYRGLEQRRRSTVTAWVPIQRGCNHRCTFCIVPYVRGSEKNRDPDEVLDEVRRVARDGITEVTLLGQTVNSYSWGEVSFARLLEAVARVPGIRRVRFTSPHPNDVTGELVEVMAREDTVCEQFHLPVQSGSNRVLRRMLRRYTAETFMEKVDLIRGALPDIALSTDVIVAFPGESEDDFEQTLDLLGRVRFDEAFTYRYSPREGTPATRLPAHQFIDDEVGQQRLERLIETTRSIQKEINQGEVGRVEELLIEREARSEGMVLGRTRRGKAAVVPGSKSDIGTYLTARLTRTTGPTFVGERA